MHGGGGGGSTQRTSDQDHTAALLDALGSVSFQGASGRVMLDEETGAPRGSFSVFNFLRDELTGRMYSRLIGIYDGTLARYNETSTGP